MQPPKSIPTDTALLSRLAERHEPSLELLMKRYWEVLYRKAFGFLRDEESAKDCVQEVFISLWEKADPVSIDNLSHYLQQAARFRAMAAMRKSKRLAEIENRSALLTQFVLHDNSPGYIFFKELKAKLENIIDTFPEQQQQIFRMSREEGMTYQQIADHLGISVKTVEKKMSLSLAEFRKHFEEGLLIALFFPFI